VAGEDPELLVFEEVGVGGVGDGGAGGEFYFDQFEGAVGGGGDGAAAVAGGGVCPDRLVGGATEEFAGAFFGSGDELGQRHAEGAGETAEEYCGGLCFSALDLADHGAGDAGSLGQRVDRQVEGDSRLLDGSGEGGGERIIHGCHYSAIYGYYRGMQNSLLIRAATESDADACAAIYAPYVWETAITFEIEPPTPAEMAERIARSAETHAWLVLEHDGRVVGYAYGTPMKPRAAYRWSCEVSIYLERGRRRTGGGRALYEALFERLTERGYRTAIAGMTLPNDASVGLHAALGFEPIGTYRNIGWKLDAWHDVAWSQRTLATSPNPPEEPR
jgi:L-amino acid N-acyltransferase YncA